MLHLRQITKRFGLQTVLQGIDLDLQAGEFVSLLGPSGCGKTTLLRIVCGIETPELGQVLMQGQDITGWPASRRRFGVVFQSYALFPNMTALENVRYGLTELPRREAVERADEMLALVGLTEQAGKFPSQLSGGQQQRVALARALAPRPKLLLLDEPLSALDAQVRQELRAEIRALQQRLGITTLMVTHDQDEALAMSDRVVLLAKGQIAQQGAPRQLYDTPASALVAGFVGRMNWMDAQVVAEGRVRIGTTLVDCDTRVYKTGSVVRVGVRPEALRLLDGEGAMIRARIDALQFQGAITQVLLRCDALGGELTLDLPSAEAAGLTEGEVRGLRLPPAAVQLFDAPLSMRRAA
ncbi:ATP-binding cassette domain-containing protein [Mitsuaria sp. GD03876]|uniref:ABC transporter ATP-binding protein n=1 Tax=Mitsuaria sp. GD03876 TaxID=2975399 RepID=UPI00244BAB99|nr:ATP-binding cassette domain-containing protein [Mitsuaria sp. GD03876]MDH0867648.1 ATP-binding cassette domain-containing protein [Mitsuaria sp. GD03876]